jgi:putative FmdB family regulatory protein
VPTYDYRCRACGHIIEVVHPMSEDGPTVCAECGGELQRMLYPTGIIFRGSGFYRTDSRSGSTVTDGGTTSTPSPAPKDPGPTAPTGSGSDS